jgi:hypothetical protein
VNWEELESGHAAMPFFARIDQAYKVDQTIRATIWLAPPGESKRAGGWFLPTDKDRYIVPAGYTTRWITATSHTF